MSVPHKFERAKTRLVVGGDYINPAGVGETISWTVNPVPREGHEDNRYRSGAGHGYIVTWHQGRVSGAGRRQEGRGNVLKLDPAKASLMCEMRPVTQRVVDEKGWTYLRLQKYLYGLPQASFRFYQSSTESSSAWFSRRYGATLASTAEKRVT